MFHKNMVFKFTYNGVSKVVPLKTITSVREVCSGMVRIATNDYVLYTISMNEEDVPYLLNTYNDWLWEQESSLKVVEFQVFSVVDRLNLDGAE